MSVDVKSDRLAKAHRRERRGRAARHRLHLHRGADLEPDAASTCCSRDMPGDTRRRWDEQNGVEVIASPSNKGNGMTLDADGRLIVCEHSTSSLVRDGPDGKNTNREVLASHYEGQELNSPNDVVRQVGRVDLVLRPVVRAHARLRRRARARARLAGRLPASARAAATRELVVEQDEYEQPNGLCFSPDESLLYINDTPKRVDQGLRRRRGQHALERPHVLRGHRHRRDRGGHPRRDEVRRAGQHLGHRPRRRLGDQRRTASTSARSGSPRTPATSTWGGPDWHTLFIPSSTSLYAVKTKVGPRREPYMS